MAAGSAGLISGSGGSMKMPNEQEGLPHFTCERRSLNSRDHNWTWIMHYGLNGLDLSYSMYIIKQVLIKQLYTVCFIRASVKLYTCMTPKLFILVP